MNSAPLATNSNSPPGDDLITIWDIGIIYNTGSSGTSPAVDGLFA